jgi:peptidoglycan/LPS O-acetylase OafA/YrhL
VYEVFFYAMFAVLLARLPRRHLPAALGLWATVIVTGRLALGPMYESPWLHLIFHPLTLEFLAGCVVALTVAQLGRRMSVACTVAGLGVMGAALTAWSIDGVAVPETWPRVLVFGPAAALLVAGLVGLERTTSVTAPRPLVRLGDASYSLYLSHVLTMSAFGLVCRYLLAAPGTFGHAATVVAAFAVAMLGGWIGYCVIEVPLLGWLRSLRRPHLHGIAPEAVVPGAAIEAGQEGELYAR